VSRSLSCASQEAGFGVDSVRLTGEFLASPPRQHYLGSAVAVRLAAELADGVRAEAFRRWGAPGIRAQLVEVEGGAPRLADDFHLEGDERSLHVLNAVSPAFTCAIPFAQFLLDEVARLARV
jgi:hypothetical protein